jgi:hypothetical protein
MSNPLEAVFLERDRLLKLKAELSAAVAHARAAAWRVEVFHPDHPPLVDHGVLQEVERLAGVIGLHWVFLTSEDAETTRPRWSCTVLPDDWGLEHIAVMVGVFPSLSQARKNGWSGVPAAGFEKRDVGPCKIHRIKVV